MKLIDRILYGLGFVRRSVFNDLREAAQEMQTEWIYYSQEMHNYLRIWQRKNKPQPPKLQIIKGGKDER